MTGNRDATKTGEYDLVAANHFGWVLGVQWFRVGLGAFAVVLLAIVTRGVYEQAVAGQLDSTRLVGAILIFFIIGLMLFIVAALRSPAVRMVVDVEGLRLVYRSGKPFSQDWNDPGIDLRGRWTLGVRDTISRGKPRYSVYGRLGGLTESFIPEGAFRDLMAWARGRGLHRTDRPGNPGWNLYRLNR